MTNEELSDKIGRLQQMIDVLSREVATIQTVCFAIGALIAILAILLMYVLEK